MSKASATRTIKFISKAGTYTAMIMSESGDLYQEYEGDAPNGVTQVYPDYASSQPVLRLVITSSRAAESTVIPAGVDFYFNNTLIEFDASGNSTGQFAGYFKKVKPAEGVSDYYGLRITGNIARASLFAPITIKMVATIVYGQGGDSIQAFYSIPVQKSTGSSYHVTIAAGDNNNFVISEKQGSCILSAKVYLKDAEITDNLTYKWEKMNGTSGWQVLTAETSATLTVHEADIDTYGEYRVKVYQGDSLLGTDIQGVMDTSDPYEIVPNPLPADETIYEDESGNGSVRYTPAVVSRGSATPVSEFTEFHFIVKDGAGVIVGSTFGTPQSSFDVTRDMCLQAGGDVSVTITTAD